METMPSSEPTVTGEPDAPPARKRYRRGAVAIVVALTVIGAVVGAAACWYVFLRPSEFTAEALVAVLPDDPGAPDSSVNIAAVWVEVGNAPTVLHPVATEVGTPEPEVANAVVISQPAGVPLLSVTATTPDADTSATLANAVAARLLLQDQQGRVGHYHLQQVSQARSPVHPDSTVGAAGAVGAALLGGAAGGLLGRPIVRRHELAR
jgi:capsular polysaccharide biosynthesis protein